MATHDLGVAQQNTENDKLVDLARVLRSNQTELKVGWWA